VSACSTWSTTRDRGNALRAQNFAPVKPLRLEAKLERAALGHSQDMATNSYMAHEGHDGSTFDHV